MTMESSPDTSAREENAPVCIVTGLSGAGKSVALRVFEDLGYFTVDGLPASLTPEMVGMMRRPSMEHFRGIALGMDLRQNDFLRQLNAALLALAEEGVRAQVLFVEAHTSTLLRRYAATRRPHPLERGGFGLEAAIAAERERLRPLREMADFVVDTSRLSIHDLRRIIQKRWTRGPENLHHLRVNLLSFGFKYGVPAEADFVFDMRFLANPYFEESLREKSGKDKAVADYVFAAPAAVEFRNKLTDLVLYMLPLMETEGRYRVTLAVGCTGGRHRSVAMAEYLRRVLRQSGYAVAMEHRHLELG
ncbi:RNase adapter RapZ [Desulfovibrio piger]|nr:RNase adapter RapZ [Desulfovibrio piger]